MKNRFDELTKSLAQSVTRRGALKKFGVGLAGMALACFGLANRAEADSRGCRAYRKPCKTHSDCCSGACIGGNCACTTYADCPPTYTSCGLGVCFN
jgi:hypothetical protein